MGNILLERAENNVDFEKIFENVKSVKLTGGIFGNTTHLLMVLCICVAGVSAMVGTWWVALLLMLPVVFLVFYALKRCLDFAEKNPQAAIMDGGEFLVHEQIVHGRKGQEELPPAEPTTDHQLPPIIEAEVVSQDLPPERALEGSTDNNETEGM